MGFLAPGLLIGLTAMVIPAILQRIRRRPIAVIEWPAMRFLMPSTVRTRSRLPDRWWLLLVRTVLVGMIVLAMAGPLPMLGRLGTTPGVTTWLLVDGSGSMEFAGERGTLRESAIAEGLRRLDGLTSGTPVGLMLVRGGGQVLVEPTTDYDLIRSRLTAIPPSLASAGWPAAFRTLGKRPGAANWYCITDGRRHGWTDPATKEAWQLWSLERPAAVRVDWHFLKTGPLPTTMLPPLQIEPSPLTIGQEGRLRVPMNTDVSIDGARVLSQPELSIPAERVGRYGVSVRLKDVPVRPGAQRLLGFEVVAPIEVLLVDGSVDRISLRQPSDFLRDALAPQRDPQPRVKLRTVGRTELEAGLTPKPTVVILQDPTADLAAMPLLANYLNTGGTLAILHGPNTLGGAWDGVTWLPAKPIDALDTARTIAPEATPHPMFAPFRGDTPGDLRTATFRRVTRFASATSVVSRWDDGSPWLLERRIGKGRVLQSAVPLAPTWPTDLFDRGDFVRLAHEMVRDLAGAVRPDVNARAGAPIEWNLADASLPTTVTVRLPDGSEVRREVERRPFVFTETTEPGIYRFTLDVGAESQVCVQPDAGEEDGQPLTAEDQAYLRELVGTSAPAATGERMPTDLTLLLAAMAIGFLLLECRLAGRVVRGWGTV